MLRVMSDTNLKYTPKYPSNYIHKHSLFDLPFDAIKHVFSFMSYDYVHTVSVSSQWRKIVFDVAKSNSSCPRLYDILPQIIAKKCSLSNNTIEQLFTDYYLATCYDVEYAKTNIKLIIRGNNVDLFGYLASKTKLPHIINIFNELIGYANADMLDKVLSSVRYDDLILGDLSKRLCHLGDITRVNILFSHICDGMTTHEFIERWSLKIEAARYDKLDLVLHLQNIRNSSPYEMILCACQYNSMRVIGEFISRYDGDLPAYRHFLSAAASSGSEDATRLLIERMPSVIDDNCRTLIHDRIRIGYPHGYIEDVCLDKKIINYDDLLSYACKCVTNTRAKKYVDMASNHNHCLYLLCSEIIYNVNKIELAGTLAHYATNVNDCIMLCCRKGYSGLTEILAPYATNLNECLELSISDRYMAELLIKLGATNYDKELYLATDNIAIS